MRATPSRSDAHSGARIESVERSLAKHPSAIKSPPMVASLLADNVSEGKHVLLAMLIVGLVFIGVIGVGELTRTAGHKRQARRPPARASGAAAGNELSGLILAPTTHP